MSTPARKPDPSEERAAPEVPSARRATVEAARQVWIRKLIDLSRRNSLLYYRPLKTGTLEFSSAPPERLHELLAGESVPVASCCQMSKTKRFQNSLETFLAVRWRTSKKRV